MSGLSESKVKEFREAFSLFDKVRPLKEGRNTRAPPARGASEPRLSRCARLLTRRPLFLRSGTAALPLHAPARLEL